MYRDECSAYVIRSRIIVIRLIFILVRKESIIFLVLINSLSVIVFEGKYPRF